MPVPQQNLPSFEQRLAALELGIRELTAAMSQLQIMRANPNALPVMPDGSGRRLSEARRRAGWSGKDLAAAIGVSKSTLSLWELERLALPRWRAQNILDIFTNAGLDAPFVIPAQDDE